METKEKSIVLPVGSVPMGTIIAFALTEGYIPEGWLVCNGTPIPSEYATLIKLIGPNTPNLIGRTLIGCSTQKVSNPFYPFGQMGGEATHSLTVSEMPSHSHTINSGDFGIHHRSFKGDDDPDKPFETSPDQRMGGTDYSGGNQAHNNMQPYCALNYIIYAGNAQ
jgi:microcystin-dependent protein